MTYCGRNRYHALKSCPECGKDAGRRKMREGTKEEYFVVCLACGYRTKGYASQTAATTQWNRRADNAAD